MLNVDKKDYGFNLANFKRKIPQKSKFKMKWKTIQWLLNNKKDSIKQLFSNYSLMLKYAKRKVIYSANRAVLPKNGRRS